MVGLLGKSSMSDGTRKSSKSAKARMSRRQPPGSIPGRRVEDPKQAYTKERLEEIGAITLLWNQVDGFIDWLLQISLKLPIWARGGPSEPHGRHGSEIGSPAYRGQPEPPFK
jgi:hypothetical protein